MIRVGPRHFLGMGILNANFGNPLGLGARYYGIWVLYFHVFWELEDLLAGRDKIYSCVALLSY